MFLSTSLLILSIGLFGKIGFVITSTLLFINLVTLNSYNVYYLYPFIPFDLGKILAAVFLGSAIEKRMRNMV